MAKAAPAVSVIIPVFNREKTLAKALQSVLSQTFTDFEVVVVDDGSLDGSGRMVEKVPDSRVRLLRHEKNRGAAAARNTGIEAARGEFIAFQDSDDWWEPGKLSLQMERFSDAAKELGLVYSAFWRYRDNSREYIPGREMGHLQKEGRVVESLLLNNFITPQTVVVRKECFKKAGLFDESMPRFHDWELWLRLAGHYQFAFIDQPLVNVYFSEKSISASQDDLLTALSYIYEKHNHLYVQAGKRFQAGMVFSYGHNLCLAGRMAEGKAQLKRALKLDPQSIRCWLALAGSLWGYSGYKWIYGRFKKLR